MLKHIVKVKPRIFLAIALVCVVLVVIVISVVVSPVEPKTLHGLIRALAGDGSLRLSDRAYSGIVAEIRSCNNVELLEACMLAALNGSAGYSDADTGNRISNIWDGHCVNRLVSIGTEEAASVLVRMLDHTDAGGTLSVTIAITEIGLPALAPLREHKGKGSTSDLREKLRRAIEQGEVWSP